MFGIEASNSINLALEEMLGLSSRWGSVLSLSSVSMLEKVETPSCSADHTQLLRILVLAVSEELLSLLFSLVAFRSAEKLFRGRKSCL